MPPIHMESHLQDTRYTSEEKERFKNYLTDKLYQYGWSVNRQEYYLATVCKNPEVTLSAHFDTGKTLPWYVTKFYELFGYQRWVYLPACGLVFLLLLALWVPVITLPVLLLLAIQLLTRRKNPFNCNDNTSGVMILLEVAKRVPDLQGRVQLVFTDEEENGRKGAKQYSKKKPKLLLNFDTVGLGDILIISTNKENPPPELLQALDAGKYRIIVKKHFSNSDYREFDNGIGFAFVEESFLKGGFYLPNAHTVKDQIIGSDNIVWLVSGIVKFVSFLQKKGA